MLRVDIINIGRNQDETANYHVAVRTGGEQLADFRVSHFDRSRGWRELLMEVAKKAMKSKS